jgi:hypothetical protein
MNSGYAYEKFYKAIHGMAASPAPIQKRIADAYVYNLIHVKAEELPQEIQFKFRELQHKLTAVEPKNDEGSVYATTSKMSTEEAVEIAESIVFMADIVTSNYNN